MECNICLEQNKYLNKCLLCNYYLCTNCLHTYLIKYGQNKCPQCRRDGLIKFINIYKNNNLKFKCIQIILVTILYFLIILLTCFTFYLRKKHLNFYIYLFHLCQK